VCQELFAEIVWTELCNGERDVRQIKLKDEPFANFKT
jgi:hypothetical protein